MREPNHPWRAELSTAVERLIDELATNPEMRARGEELKARLMAYPAVTKQIDTVWIEIEAGLDPLTTSNQLFEALEQMFMTIAERLAND